MTDQEKYDIQKQIDELKEKNTEQKDREVYQKQKAESETKEMAVIMTDPVKSLQTKLNTKVAQVIDSSEIVNQKIEATTNKVVESGLKAQENTVNATVTKSENAMLEADFEKNKNEYLYHGIDHKVDKEWKRKLILAMNDIWFVIWAIVSFFTIVPVSTFLSRVKALGGLVKGVAVIVGILLGLSVAFGLTYYILKWCGVPIF